MQCRVTVIQAGSHLDVPGSAVLSGSGASMWLLMDTAETSAFGLALVEGNQ